MTSRISNEILYDVVTGHYLDIQNEKMLIEESIREMTIYVIRDIPNTIKNGNTQNERVVEYKKARSFGELVEWCSDYYCVLKLFNTLEERDEFSKLVVEMLGDTFIDSRSFWSFAAGCCNYDPHFDIKYLVVRREHLNIVVKQQRSHHIHVLAIYLSARLNELQSNSELKSKGMKQLQDLKTIKQFFRDNDSVVRFETTKTSYTVENKLLREAITTLIKNTLVDYAIANIWAIDIYKNKNAQKLLKKITFFLYGLIHRIDSNLKDSEILRTIDNYYQLSGLLIGTDDETDQSDRIKVLKHYVAVFRKKNR